MIRRISAVILTVAMLALGMLLCLAGCGQSNAMIMVGLALSAGQEGDKTGELLQSALEESGHSVELACAQTSQEQTEQLGNLMKDGASVLVVQSVDSVAVENLFNDPKNDVSDLTVIACGAPIAADCVKAYVGPDLYDAARQQAEQVVKELNLNEPERSYTVELVAGNGAERAVAGAMEVLQPYVDKGTVTISAGSDVESCHTEDPAARIAQLCKDTYAEQELDAVLCLGEGQVSQVIEALKENYTGAAWPVVTGYGCDEEIVGYLASKMLTMTAYPEELTTEQLTELVTAAIAATEEERQDTVIPCSAVTRGNYKKLLIKSGLYTKNKDGSYTKN